MYMVTSTGTWGKVVNNTTGITGLANDTARSLCSLFYMYGTHKRLALSGITTTYLPTLYSSIFHTVDNVPYENNIVYNLTVDRAYLPMVAQNSACWM